MGSFKISVKGIGAATANEVNATHVRSAHINFQPGKHFKNMLTTLKYEVKR
jgi:hypothetical protein